MDQIFKIKDAVFNYLSPVAKRRRTMGPQTPGYNRVDEEHQFFSEPRNNRRDLEFAYDRMNQNFVAPADQSTPSRNPLKRPREDDEVAGPIFSGDEISPNHSSSQNLTATDESSEVNPDLMDEDEDEEEEEDEISAQQKVNEYLAKQAAELARAKERVGQARAEGEWSPEEMFLLERLQYLGHEAILPSWARQFYLKTVPEAMWCGKDERGSLLGDESKAIQMLLYLNNYLARRVQGRYYSGNGAPEHQMKIFISKYVQYSEREGGYDKKKFIPVLCLVKGRWKASAAETTKRLKDQMDFHAESWRRSLLRPSPIVNGFGETEIYVRRPPIIYGILYIQAKALFVTLDSSNPEAKIRDIHVCDFLDTTKDFWNAVSVAIVVKCAQKYMESIKDELEDDDPPEPDSDSDGDLESRKEREKRLLREAKKLEREKERQREEDLLRMEQEMRDIKMEEDADHVMESIEEYERVEVIEGEEEEEEEEEDGRPSASEYDEEDDEAQVGVEIEESDDMEEGDGEEVEENDDEEVEEEDDEEIEEGDGEEVQDDEEVQDGEEVEEDDDEEIEEYGDNNESASEDESEHEIQGALFHGVQYEIEQSPESTSSDVL